MVVSWWIVGLLPCLSTFEMLLSAMYVLPKAMSLQHTAYHNNKSYMTYSLSEMAGG